MVPEGERRQATVLSADIAGYTALCATMDPEAHRFRHDVALRLAERGLELATEQEG